MLLPLIRLVYPDAFYCLGCGRLVKNRQTQRLSSSTVIVLPANFYSWACMARLGHSLLEMLPTSARGNLVNDHQASPAGIAELAAMHRRLGCLLEKPEPGLSSWRITLNKLLLDMACYAGVGTAPKHAAELLKRLEAFVRAYDAERWPIENDIGLFSAARETVAKCNETVL